MLVLASASPRRKELLAQASYDFRAIASSVPEERHPGEDPTAFVTRLAHEKARSIFDRHIVTLDSLQDSLLVLGADTIVVVGEEFLGKPRDAEDAARMLHLLSGRTHQVITGVCLLSQETIETACETTSVFVEEISDDEIAAYIDTGEPMDKAGAYGIQGYAARWIPRIEGCYFNVVGLPIALVAKMIERHKTRPRHKTEADVSR